MADDPVREVHDEGNRRSDLPAGEADKDAGARRAGVTKRPKVLSGATYRVETGCGHLYVAVNCNAAGEMIEVIERLGKAGGCAACFNESIGRLVTALLREGVDPKVIIRQLDGMQCPSSHNGKHSCPAALATALKQALEESEHEDSQGKH